MSKNIDLTPTPEDLLWHIRQSVILAPDPSEWRRRKARNVEAALEGCLASKASLITDRTDLREGFLALFEADLTANGRSKGSGEPLTEKVLIIGLCQSLDLLLESFFKKYPLAARPNLNETPSMEELQKAFMAGGQHAFSQVGRVRLVKGASNDPEDKNPPSVAQRDSIKNGHDTYWDAIDDACIHYGPDCSLPHAAQKSPSDHCWDRYKEYLSKGREEKGRELATRETTEKAGRNLGPGLVRKRISQLKFHLGEVPSWHKARILAAHAVKAQKKIRHLPAEGTEATPETAPAKTPETAPAKTPETVPAKSQRDEEWQASVNEISPDDDYQALAVPPEALIVAVAELLQQHTPSTNLVNSLQDPGTFETSVRVANGGRLTFSQDTRGDVEISLTNGAAFLLIPEKKARKANSMTHPDPTSPPN